jgi:membrane protease YdiL (CAAX protease family)
LKEAATAIGPVVLAALVAAWIDLRTRRAGLDPPGFAEPLRRWAWLVLLAGALWVGVFGSLGATGGEVDLAAVRDWQLFALHGLFVALLLAWYALGFAGTRPAAPTGAGEPTRDGFRRQLGLAAREPWKEIGLGLVFGVGAWLAVLGGVLALGLALSALGGEDLLPQEPPELIPWIAGRAIGLRVLIALSAGVVEETFFRGFLQPRVGIPLSTALFALAHAAYGQPFLLVGVTLLSLLYAALVRWRQSLHAAITAHFLFDAIQLLVVIPSILRMWNPDGAG